MNRTQLLELLLNRENSGLEFKRDDILPEKLAGEVVALLEVVDAGSEPAKALYWGWSALKTSFENFADV